MTATASKYRCPLCKSTGFQPNAQGGCTFCDGTEGGNPPLPVISSSLPDLVNSYIAYRAQRLQIEAQAEEVKKVEEELKKTIIAKMREQDMTAVGGTNGLVKLTTLVEPVAESWELTWDYIRKNNAFHLLHKRLTNAAVKEIWETGETIPGVGKQTIYKLTPSGVK